MLPSSTGGRGRLLALLAVAAALLSLASASESDHKVRSPSLPLLSPEIHAAVGSLASRRIWAPSSAGSRAVAAALCSEMSKEFVILTVPPILSSGTCKYVA
ncbi:hypothetical protein EJB05_02609, partial [Eragrostis curvula]